MSRGVVLTNTTDVIVKVYIIYKLYIKLYIHLLNLTEKHIILPEIYWIKVKPD